MNFENLREKLFELQDEEFKNFQEKLLPTVAKEKIIGIKTPELKKFAKEFFTEETAKIFLNDLPHKYFEENSIHVMLINGMKNYSDCINSVKFFLPRIDNWANCDSLVPKIFSKHTEELESEIKSWLDSKHTYTLRFAILMLMKFYLGKNFDKKYLSLVAEVKNKNYYVEMIQAWYFAEALIKQYDSAIIFLQENLLSPNVHRKTIQKAVESFRISEDKKIYLKTLRRKIDKKN